MSEVWGIGKRLTAHLQGMGIRTAWDLSRAAPGLLRKTFSVVVEKTARELAEPWRPHRGAVAIGGAEHRTSVGD